MGDRSNFLERIFEVLERERFRYCVIGGAAVNAYVEPLITQDLDIVLAVDEIPRALEVFSREFRVEEFEHSVNVYDPGSRLQVQIQRDPLLTDILGRAEVREVMDFPLPVAAPEDLVRLKVAAATDSTRRASKRGKDLLDLARLLVAFPALTSLVPGELLDRVRPFMDEPQA